MAGNALLDSRHVLAAAGVAPGMSIADFGVGRTGHLIFPAASLVGDEGRVYGVDLAKDALKMLEGRRRQYLVHNIDLVHGDIEYGDLSIPEQSVDRIFLVHTLPLLQKRGKVIAEMRRLLRHQGRIVVIDWLPNTQHPVAPTKDFRLHPNESDFTFAQNGCSVCEAFSPSNAHWGRIYMIGRG